MSDDKSNYRHVILLTHESVAARLIANRIHDRIGLHGIVIATNVSTRGPFPGLMRPKSAAKWLLGPSGYQIYCAMTRELFDAPPLERRVRAIERRLQTAALESLHHQTAGAASEWPEWVPVLRAPNMNDPLVRAWCADKCAALLVTYGTGILHEPIISLPPLGVLNAHSSLLPHFRGTRSEFWIVLEQAFYAAGVTVHFIDRGVDTGDIVMQRQVKAATGIDPYQLRIANVFATADLLPDAIERVLEGTALREPQSVVSGPARRARDITLQSRADLLTALGYEV